MGSKLVAEVRECKICGHRFMAGPLALDARVWGGDAPCPRWSKHIEPDPGPLFRDPNLF